MMLHTPPAQTRLSLLAVPPAPGNYADPYPRTARTADLARLVDRTGRHLAADMGTHLCVHVTFSILTCSNTVDRPLLDSVRARLATQYIRLAQSLGNRVQPCSYGK